MQSYEESQRGWAKNIGLLEKARNRLNNKAFSKNYRANVMSSEGGKDITLIDRLDIEVDEYQNKELMPITF